MTFPYPVRWVPAHPDKWAEGRKGRRVEALVHHRMVGFLSGTDALFSRSANGSRVASTHFGIGWSKTSIRNPAPREDSRIVISQYVDVADRAYGNGNWHESAPTGERFKVDANARTISIEHEDGADFSKPSGRGVIDERIWQASIALDRLLFSADLEAWRAAGIRCRDPRIADQLRDLEPSSDTLLNHNDIAGRLKPYCLRPWMDDTVGFPRDRFVRELLLSQPTPSPRPSPEADPMLIPDGRQALMRDGATLHDTSALALPFAVELKGGDDVVTVVGAATPPSARQPSDLLLVEYELRGDSRLGRKGERRQLWTRHAHVAAYRPVPAPPKDCSAEIEAAVAPIRRELGDRDVRLAKKDALARQLLEV